MDKALKIILLSFLPVLSFSQQSLPDSLRKIFLNAKSDSVRCESANHLYDFYEELNSDSAFFYADQTVLLSGRNNKKLNEAYSLTRKAYQELNLGRYAASLNSLLAAFYISEKQENDNYYWKIHPLKAEKQKRLYTLSCTHHIYAILMRVTLNKEQEIIHFKEAKRIADQINSPARSLLADLNLGRFFWKSGNLDSALIYLNEGQAIAKNSGHEKHLSTIFYFTAVINIAKGDRMIGLNYYYRSIESGIAQNNIDGLAYSFHGLAEYYLYEKNKDSSLYYACKSLEAMKQLGRASNALYNLGDAYVSLNNAYLLKGELDSAYKYLTLGQTTSDSIKRYGIQSLADFQKLTLNEQQRLQAIEKERITYQNRIRTYFLLSGIGVFLVLAIIFYRNNRQKHKAKLKIEQAYDNLKSTQSQLIQSEKMASLGELTAGIAHEIQNPLNFVNNFSEVSNELIDEMNLELDKGDINEAKAIAADVKNNLEKINHHGKRADAIVKGMLQHSRTSTDKKELTDINALADEYLRLSYQSLRAKDKTFNATFKTDFDPSLEKINIIPQDIGRVILNLLTNAFYVVNEKKKQHPNGYEPTVSVETKKINNTVAIKVTDNGNGIPQKILDKIFQPFFTTKPTGQGTGLGLSLSYDIIKAHGGEIKVDTKEGEGTEFTIILPA